MRLTFVVSALLLGQAGSLSAQVFVGRIVDADRGRGIPLASVELLVGDAIVGVALADRGGQFRIGVGVLEREMLIWAAAPSYQPGMWGPFEVENQETVDVGDLVLERMPIPLNAVEVEGRTSRLTPGQEWVRQHQLLGKGLFFAGALLAALNPPSLTRHLAEESGFWVREDYSDSRPTADFDPLAVGAGLNLNRFGHPFLRMRPGSRCLYVAVLVNRWPLERTGYRSLDDIPLERIAAIEVYRDGREVPPGYIWDSGCALVNVWTWDSWSGSGRP